MKKNIIFIELIFFFSTNLFSQVWNPVWSNYYNSWIGNWYIDGYDKYISGNFVLGSNFKNKGDFLCINGYDGWSMTQRSLGPNGWINDWHNNGNWYLASWHITSNDIYVPIHKLSGSGKSSILAINHSNGWAMVLSLLNSPYWHWTVDWGNDHNNHISGWNLDPADRYISGNFEGTNNDEELLLINPNNKWSALLRCNTSSWTDLWANGGSGTFPGWYIRNDDIFLSGDLDGCGCSELICVNRNTRWAAIYKYQNSTWTAIWSNGGNYNAGLGGWVSFGNTDYVVNDFNNDGAEEILFICKDNNWATLKKYDGNLYWPDLFCNYGNGWIGGWHIAWPDKYVAGKFWGNERTLTGINNSNDYAAMQKFNNGQIPQVEDNLKSQNLVFKLSQNYPNPFNIETNIDFSIERRGKTELKIYDIVGKEIKTLINEQLEPNCYTIKWNGKDNYDRTISTGIYFMKLISGDKVETKKLIVVK